MMLRPHPPAAWRPTAALAAPLALASLLALPAPALAEAQGPRREIEALRVQTAPTLDGRLDEAAWASARFSGDFVQKEPSEGAPSSLPTEVALVYDDDALYIGARMAVGPEQQGPPLLTRRDESSNANRFIVSFDTFRDRRTAYSFAVTAAGVRVDWFHPSDHEHDRDHAFNPVWSAASHIEGERWEVEMRIPFTQLRFPDAPEQRWGINFNRYLPDRNEDAFWIPVPRDEVGWSSYFGELRGITGVRPARGVELLPYLATGAALVSGRALDPANPFDQAAAPLFRLGGDAKVGLGPALTLDLTVLPDFGQVEADPAEVNLSAYESFFPERRPFFLEGAEIFRIGRGEPLNLFYSRRIGAAPRGSVSADHVERLRSTDILGAAKVSGRAGPRWSLGALAALTGEATARTHDLATDTISEATVEPLSAFGVLRAQRLLGGRGSTMGAYLTAVQRDLSPASPLSAQLARGAYAGALDADLYLGDGNWRLSSYLAGSLVTGEASYISALQSNPRHFFQRPDQDHVSVDPSATQLAGGAANLLLEKIQGRWLGGLYLGTTSPGFEINDAGLLRRADRHSFWAGLTYQETTPGPLLHRWNVGPFVFGEGNYGGVLTELGAGVKGRLVLPSFWSLFLEAGALPAALNDSLTRGGPLMLRPAIAFGNAHLASNYSANTRANLSVNLGRDALGGARTGLNATLSTRVGQQAELSVGAGLDLAQEPQQYLGEYPGGPTETFGSQYVFAHSAQEQVYIRLRGRYAFTPDLSLELYAEPFAAAGRFTGLHRLTAAGTDETLPFGEGGTTLSHGAGAYEITDGAVAFSVPDPDYLVTSLRSSLVLRWEWTPGSTLFLVWQQGLGGAETSDRALSAADLFASATAPGSHVLALKISIWAPVTF